MLQDYDAETDQQQGEGLQGVQSYSPDVPQVCVERKRLIQSPGTPCAQHL